MLHLNIVIWYRSSTPKTCSYWNCQIRRVACIDWICCVHLLSISRFIWKISYSFAMHMPSAHIWYMYTVYICNMYNNINTFHNLLLTHEQLLFAIPNSKIHLSSKMKTRLSWWWIPTVILMMFVRETFNFRACWHMTHRSFDSSSPIEFVLNHVHTLEFAGSVLFQRNGDLKLFFN